MFALVTFVEPTPKQVSQRIPTRELLGETAAERPPLERVRDWQLERETEIVNLKDTVFIPDFAFRRILSLVMLTVALATMLHKSLRGPARLAPPRQISGDDDEELFAFARSQVHGGTSSG